MRPPDLAVCRCGVMCRPERSFGQKTLASDACFFFKYLPECVVVNTFDFHFKYNERSVNQDSSTFTGSTPVIVRTAVWPQTHRKLTIFTCSGSNCVDDLL